MERINLPKSSAHVLVQTLVSEGYIALSPHNSKLYVLGIATYTLGMRYLQGLNFVDACAYELDPLADEFGKTGFVAVLKDQYVVYMHKYVSSKSIISSCALGSQKEAYSTALGKSIFAFMPEPERTRLIDGITFKSITSNTITDRSRFVEVLDAIRRKGYALDIRENDNALACAAVPVFDYSGKVIASMSLSDIYKPGEDLDVIGEELKQAAKRVSRALGFLPQ
jgi:DNA-binding IclR family transcriptional regulator